MSQGRKTPSRKDEDPELEIITAGCRLPSLSQYEYSSIDPITGAIPDAKAGNVIFKKRGKPNHLSDIGKVVLDRIISGKFKRNVTPFKPHEPSVQPEGTPIVAGFQRNLETIDFETERQRCLDEKKLFEDTQFPANNSSLYYKTRPNKPIAWKRPEKIDPHPRFIVGEKSRFDVKQGDLGDCWLLAAVATLTLRDELFYRVVPPDQSFTENYAGIFHFQFWRYGQWVDVVIDDLLPTVDGELCYMRSENYNEFWSALLEKAYAKLYGSYEHLARGCTAEALEDFTGGLTEFLDLPRAQKSTIETVLRCGMKRGSLFGCSIDVNDDADLFELPNGLVVGHAYSITGMYTHKINGGEITLLRIRNPWGDSEWNGPWSDGSAEWNQVDPHQREQLGLKLADDGEFWMSIDDFKQQFTQMECCNLSADIMDEIYRMLGGQIQNQQKRTWIGKSRNGEWNSKKGTAGGFLSNPTFCNNPQYGVQFKVSDDSVEKDGQCTVIVAVLQKYRRELRSKNLDNLCISFSVYRSDGSNQRLQSTKGKTLVVRTNECFSMREKTFRFRVSPGQYIIVPSTLKPHENGDFLLRVFAEAEFPLGLLGQTPRVQTPKTHQPSNENSSSCSIH